MVLELASNHVHFTQCAMGSGDLQVGSRARKHSSLGGTQIENDISSLGNVESNLAHNYKHVDVHMEVPRKSESA